MSHGAAQVDQPALSQDDDVITVLQEEAINLRRRRKMTAAVTVQRQNRQTERKRKQKNRYQTFQPSYLRLDVDLLDSVFGEPAHVDLTVKVSDVADDGVVLHVFKVTEGNTQLLACN